jgi:hypothetical protein
VSAEHYESHISSPAQQPRNGIAQVVAFLEKVVVEGLRHGFFDCSIACEIGNGGKRELVIRSGKSFKFIVREEELPQ